MYPEFRRNIAVLSITLFILSLLIIPVTADRLPSQVPENQLFDVDTVIDATGMIDETSSLDWIIADGNEGAVRIDYDPKTPHYIVPLTKYNNEIKPYWDSIGVIDTHIIRGTNVEITSFIIPTSAISKTQAPNGTSTFQRVIDDAKRLTREVTVTELSTAIPTGKIIPGQEVAVVKYKDHILTNGGKIAENKHFTLDTRNKTAASDNIVTDKLITYAGTEGSHLIGEESYLLDVAGGYESAASGQIRCIFSKSESDFLPAFCNVVKAKSNLVNFDSGQISTQGNVRLIGESTDIPAVLSYKIAITPDSNSGSGFAKGTVSTILTGHILEGRDNSTNVSSDYTWKDETSGTGGIKNFQKTFDYQSGLKL